MGRRPLQNCSHKANEQDQDNNPDKDPLTDQASAVGAQENLLQADHGDHGLKGGVLREGEAAGFQRGAKKPRVP